MRNSTKLKLLFVLVLLLGALTAGGCGGRQEKMAKTQALLEPAPIPEPLVLTPEQRHVKQILDQDSHQNRAMESCVLVVHKKSRKMVVYRGLKPYKTYPVVLGGNPVGDKLCQGDSCTPEGVYHVVTKFEHPRWSKFILLDYPNTQNWRKFAQAKQTGRVPLEADIGGEVGIHGTDDDLKNLAGENWTLGCVSLRNRDVEEIYPLINEATLVVIEKH